MPRKSVIKVSYICNLFRNDNKLLEKGEKAEESGRVTSFVYDAERLFLKGSVLASEKGKSYSVEVLLKENHDVQSSKCECPRGLALCHHVAALLLHAHYNVSVAMSKKKGANESESRIKSVDELFPSKKFKACSSIPSNVKELTYNLLKSKGIDVGFTWLLSPERTETNSHVLPSD